jgi:peptidoglycan/xylan/chitin deacetylase (PgdA/CDA1 family)
MAPAPALTLATLKAVISFTGFGVVRPFGPPVPPAPPPPPAERVRLDPKAAESIRSLRPIRLIDTTDQAVAITFDACATRTHHASFDRRVFDILKKEQIPTTIFVSGKWVEAHPEVMKELAADPMVEFGDHSYEHPHMSNLPVARIVEEIDQTEAALAKYGKRSVAFRPPFGEWSARLVYVVQNLQLPTVTWDVVSGDPSAQTTTNGMIKTVLANARPGSIIIFHINGRGHKTADALPAILQGLRERGFRFLQLSELMATSRAAPVRVAPIPLAPLPPNDAPPAGPPVSPLGTSTLPPLPPVPVPE